MQLDRVLRDAGLTMLKVEEGDSGHDGVGADADCRTSNTHLLSP